MPTVIIGAGLPNAATTPCHSLVARKPLSRRDVALPIGSEPSRVRLWDKERHHWGALATCPTAMLRSDVKVASSDGNGMVSLDRQAGASLGTTVDWGEGPGGAMDDARRVRVGQNSATTLTRGVRAASRGRERSQQGSIPTGHWPLGALSAPTIDDFVWEYYCKDFASALIRGRRARCKGGGGMSMP